MNELRQQLIDCLTAIESEMRRIDYWQTEALPDEAYSFHKAFAMDTMAYSQWLQFVFLPRARSVIESGGELPPSSSVGTQAVREFDGADQASQLTRLLSEFDAHINNRP